MALFVQVHKQTLNLNFRKEIEFNVKWPFKFTYYWISGKATND